MIALDDETLAYLGEHSSILARLAERAAPMFAAFSSGLHIQQNRVVPPGGDAAVPLWETVTLEKVTRVDRFVAQLFELDEGRLAYLYDTIGQFDAPHRAFTLGLWMPNAQTRADRFKALATTGIDAFKDWHIRQQPFGRAAYDLSMVLARLQVDEGGAAIAPGSRGLWSRVFAGIGCEPLLNTVKRILKRERYGKRDGCDQEFGRAETGEESVGLESRPASARWESEASALIGKAKQERPQ